MFNFLFNQYELEKITFSQFKALLIKFNLQSEINIVENIETKDLKFTRNDYVLQSGEKFLNESEFWTQ